MTLRTLGLSLSLVLATGCYVESVDDRMTDAGTYDTSKRTPLNLKDSCNYDYKSGCFIGTIPSSPDITVDGKTFMDVNDLANRFHELIDVTGVDDMEELVEGEDFELKLATQLNNENFTRGFEVYLKGEYYKTARVLASGQFAFNKLPEGEYMVRVQRPVRFVLERTVIEETAEGELVETDVKKHICATLFSDAPVQVNLTERERKTFDNFELYVTGDECVEHAAGTPIFLP